MTDTTRLRELEAATPSHSDLAGRLDAAIRQAIHEAWPEPYMEGVSHCDDVASAASVAARSIPNLARLDRLEKVAAAARDYSPRYDHDWRCEYPKDKPECECGCDDLRAALAELDTEGESDPGMYGEEMDGFNMTARNPDGSVATP